MIQAGQTVKLKHGVVHNCPEGRADNATAVVRGLIEHEVSAGAMMDRDLHGCLFWNVNDLELVESDGLPH